MERLVKEIRKILAHAIDCGGSSISDFLNASQENGYFQINFKVYGREGMDCTDALLKLKNRNSAGEPVISVQNVRSDGIVTVSPKLKGNRPPRIANARITPDL